MKICGFFNTGNKYHRQIDCAFPVEVAETKRGKPVVFRENGKRVVRQPDPKVKPGLQMGKIGSANVWLLPNPSGLNAHYQLKDLAKLFSEIPK